MDQTISLEAFNTNLHGCRILCQGPFPKNKYPPILDSIQKLREPFKKKILLSNTPFSLSKYLPQQYDAMFQVKDGNDWTMIITYITYAPKPLLVISEDIAVPDGLWSKMNRATTFVNITSSAVVQLRPYDAIFFAHMEEVASSYADYVYKALQSVYRATYSQKEHKEIVQELRIAGAGLTWTKVDEEANGSIFWYDSVHHQGDCLSNKQMSEVLGWLADQMRRE